MSRASRLIKLLENFKSWDIGGSKTQRTSTISEDFVEKQISKVYPEAAIYKLGSQQHPDFMVVSKHAANSIENFRKTLHKPKVTKTLLEMWENSDFNTEKLRIARIEVKTGKTVYTLNDTFPEPSREFGEIYVLFSIGEKKVYVTTSDTMARECRCNPPVEIRFRLSKKAVENFQKKLSKIWVDTGVSTAARPTYRINKDYAHRKATPERIAEIFAKAGLSD